MSTDIKSNAPAGAEAGERGTSDAQTRQAAHPLGSTNRAPRQIELELRTRRGDLFRVRINEDDPFWRTKALAALPDPLSPEAFALAHAPHTEAEALRWAQVCEEVEQRRAREAKLQLILAIIQRRRTLNALRAKWGRKI